MDDIVRQALAKWPNVPACYGWLLLDRRGNWRMRDEAVQHAGGLGTAIRHAALNAFIARNYDADANGQWYFQNGPQRVYVELEYAPWVVRLAEQGDGTLGLTDQIGAQWEPVGCWLDDQGAIVFSGHATGDSRERIGVLHDHDLDLFADRLVDRDGKPGESTSVAGGSQTGSTDDEVEQHFTWNGGRSLPVRTIRADELAQSFGFVTSPARQAA